MKEFIKQDSSLKCASNSILVKNMICLYFTQNRLQEKKEIKLFHFDDESENCLVFTEDYKKCLRNSEHCPHDITEKFISVLVDGSTDLTFNKTTMSSWGFQEKDIT